MSVTVSPTLYASAVPHETGWKDEPDRATHVPFCGIVVREV